MMYYDALLGEIAGSDAGSMEEVTISRSAPAELSMGTLPHGEQGRGFHQRAQIRKEMKAKIKAGNGDIITWSQIG